MERVVVSVRPNSHLGLVMEFFVLKLVAVSTTADASGTYHRYEFQYEDFDDYPKMGIWPDGYYISFNMFHGQNFVGSKVCAYERAAMLAGLPARQQCFQLSDQFFGLLPADLDGATSALVS